MSEALMSSEQGECSDDEIVESISDKYEFGWHDSDTAGQAAKRGLNEDVVRYIPKTKNEPEWMLETRLRRLKTSERKPIPAWGPDLSFLNFDQFKHFVRASDKVAQSWDDLPEDTKETYDRLGIPEAERKRLVNGVATQYESEVAYHQIRGDLEKQGVIFLDTDTGLEEHPEISQEYSGKAVPTGGNKFAALNTAVRSGGSFIYVPKGVQCEIPSQAYFRINTESMGRFERTLIIADEGAYVHYVEGCTVPIYKFDSLHAIIVKIFVRRNTRVRYTIVQNWSNNVLNLVTQRAIAEEGATMEWVDDSIGSRINMKYPSVYLTGPHARGEALPIAFVGKGQYQDTGAKMTHFVPNTPSYIVNKSISHQDGYSAYRGLVAIDKKASESKSNVLCDALLVDTISRPDTYPYADVRNDEVEMGHEATVPKVSEDQLFYLTSRGLTEIKAMSTIVRGFMEPIVKELPTEYVLEPSRLIELQMEGPAG